MPGPTMRTESAYAAFRAATRFGSLDGLRCLSILAVLWHHSGISTNIPILKRGQLGVHLFFAISGFLITTLMIRERAKYGQISLEKFYIRRSLRIFPLYYAVLLIYIVAVFILERRTQSGREFFDNLPAFASYTTNWFVDISAGARVIFYFSWSLAVEEQFYMTWPWIERFASQKAKMSVLLVLIVIVFANHVGILLSIFPPESFMHRMLWCIAPCILFGVLVAHLLHRPTGFAVAWKVLGRRWSAPFACGIVAAILCVDRLGQAWEYVVYLGLTSIVVACVIRDDNGLAKVLQWRPIARVGVISYGIYLLHMLCFNVARRVGAFAGVDDRRLIWPVGVVLVYVVAEVSYNTFERYCQTMKSRFGKR